MLRFLTKFRILQFSLCEGQNTTTTGFVGSSYRYVHVLFMLSLENSWLTREPTWLLYIAHKLVPITYNYPSCSEVKSMPRNSFKCIICINIVGVYTGSIFNSRLHDIWSSRNWFFDFGLSVLSSIICTFTSYLAY